MHVIVVCLVIYIYPEIIIKLVVHFNCLYYDIYHIDTFLRNQYNNMPHLSLRNSYLDCFLSDDSTVYIAVGGSAGVLLILAVVLVIIFYRR